MSKDRKGFTLVEIVVAVAIMGIAAVGLFNFFTSSQKQSSEIFSKSSVGQEAQKFFRMLRKDLFHAREIMFPSHGTAIKKTENFFVFRNQEDAVIMYYLDKDKHIVYRKDLTKNVGGKKLCENVGNLCFAKRTSPQKYGDLHYVTAAIGFFQNSRDKSVSKRKYKRYFFTSLLLNKDTTDYYTQTGTLGESINRDRILQEFY
ncbi:type II secretion system protein [bacterium]|nr:type II secretion system protein [bacterium]